MSNAHDIAPDLVAVSLDKVRHFKFSLASFLFLGKKYGSVMAALKRFDARGNDLSGDSLETIIDFIYAGLRWEDAALTPEKVGEMLDLRNLPIVVEAIGAAVTAALPEAVTDPTEPRT